MRKLISFMHTSLDGFVAGPNGEMDWIHINEEIFDFGATFIEQTDTALYGRVTFGMMEGYWPAAPLKPNASKHDIQHGKWYSHTKKIVLSHTLKNNAEDVTVIGSDFEKRIREIKSGSGSDILIFGSPGASHALMDAHLIDEYRINLNPVVLGKGIAQFRENRINLELLEKHPFKNGVIALHYAVKK